MLNEQMLEKITREEAFELERLNQNYWQSTDDIEFEEDIFNLPEDLCIQSEQLQNLLDYEELLRSKYL